MSRVLISFLGTGNADGPGQYRTATYKINERDSGFTSKFVAAAIHKKYEVDRMILIGTMRSMWDEVYGYFAENNGGVDDEVHTQIFTECQSATSQTEIGEICHQAEIERVLGNRSKVITIHYGLTQEEIEKNTEIILGLEQFLDNGDELIVDITHSFRSLPMYLMNLLVYLQNVSEKKLKIKHICYGMLDVADELGYAPIIELKNILKVNDWISGAYTFKRFGNADKIVELLKNADAGLIQRLDAFSKTKNLNHLAELERQSQELHRLLDDKNLPNMARMIISPVVRDFITRLTVDPNSVHKHSEFQYKLALWQRNNHNYLAAAIALTESIITRIAEIFQNTPSIANILIYDNITINDVYDHDVRDKIKGLMWDEQYKVRRWAILYTDIARNVRNPLAHCTNSRFTPSKMIEKLAEYKRQYDINVEKDKEENLC